MTSSVRYVGVDTSLYRSQANNTRTARIGTTARIVGQRWWMEMPDETFSLLDGKKRYITVRVANSAEDCDLESGQTVYGDSDFGSLIGWVEPWRTCRDVDDCDDPSCVAFECSVCHSTLFIAPGGGWFVADGTPRQGVAYCPCCGAKVKGGQE